MGRWLELFGWTIPLGLALSAPSCISIEPDAEGRLFRQGSVTDGPGADAFTIGATSLDEVVARVGAPPDSYREASGEIVTTWHTRHLSFLPRGTSETPPVEGQEIEVQWVEEYFLECTFDAQGVLVSCTEGAPMPDPEAELCVCEAEDGDA